MNKDIIIVCLSTFSMFFFIMCFILQNNIKRLSRDLAKLYVDNTVMQEYIDIVKSKESNDISDELVDKENFIKFLSDSRDWAYVYIEDVQKGLNKFISEVDSHINYFDSYGDILAENMPNSVALKQISTSYKELKKLMPEEDSHEK